MAIYVGKDGKKKIKAIYAGVNGEKKKIISAWADNDGLATKVWSSHAPKFVAVGLYGLSAYSFDGINWTDMTGLDPSYNYYGVTYGNDKYITVGNNGIVYQSSDGVSWQLATQLTSSGNTLYAVCFWNGAFYATGNKTWRSEDGVNWELVNSSVYNQYAFAYNDARIVTIGQGGKVYYSDDGLTWTLTNQSSYSTKDYKALCYYEYRKSFIAMNEDASLISSSDGKNWSDSQTVSLAASSLISDGEKIYAVSTGGKIGYSKGLGVWILSAQVPSGKWFGVSKNDKIFVAVGRTTSGSYEGKIIYSDDADVWNEVPNVWSGAMFQSVFYG